MQNTILIHLIKYWVIKDTEEKQRKLSTRIKTNIPKALPPDRPVLKDPFDTNNYSELWELFNIYYEYPLERLVRYFIYVYDSFYLLSETERKDKQLLSQRALDKKKFLDRETQQLDVRAFVYLFYQHYQPEKADYETIDSLIQQYYSAEKEAKASGITDLNPKCITYLINQLYRIYIHINETNNEEYVYEPLKFLICS